MENLQEWIAFLQGAGISERAIDDVATKIANEIARPMDLWYILSDLNEEDALEEMKEAFPSRLVRRAVWRHLQNTGQFTEIEQEMGNCYI